MRWLALLAIMLFTCTLGAGPLQEKIELQLRDGIDQHPEFELWGPNARQLSRTDTRGLRIQLTPGRKQLRGVGVQPRFHIQGDFDITLTYEELVVREPIPTTGSGVNLWLEFDGSTKLTVSLTRLDKKKEKVFGANKITPGDNGKLQYQTVNRPAKHNFGRLRLIRTGAQLQYLVCDGRDSDFTEIRTLEVGTDNVKSMRAICTTGSQKGDVQVRLVSLVIQAESFSNQPTTTTADSTWGKWLLWLGLGFLLVLVSVLGMLYWKKWKRDDEPD